MNVLASRPSPKHAALLPPSVPLQSSVEDAYERSLGRSLGLGGRKATKLVSKCEADKMIEYTDLLFRNALELPLSGGVIFCGWNTFPSKALIMLNLMDVGDRDPSAIINKANSIQSTMVYRLQTVTKSCADDKNTCATVSLDTLMDVVQRSDVGSFTEDDYIGHVLSEANACEEERVHLMLLLECSVAM